MDKCKEIMTFDCIPNVLDEKIESSENVPSVVEEINRCRNLYEKRQEIKRKKAIDIKPLYYEHMRKRDLVAKYPVYKFVCIYPKPPKKSDCIHTGKIVLDRDILSKEEHITVLAQPKQSFGSIPKPPKVFYQKRFLPNCTTRIESLAQPKPIRVRHNWKDYLHLLSVRQANNLRNTLQKPPIEYTTIENAITYIHEERRLKKMVKNEAIRKCVQIKRKLLKLERKQIKKIVFALYEVMKDFLMNDKFIIPSNEMSNLCKVLELKVAEFCAFENTPTIHTQHLIRTVAQNLAIWIEKFTQNCGFQNARDETQEQKEPCSPQKEKEIFLPVDDYISFHSTSDSDELDDFLDAEDYTEGGEYEEDINQ